MCKPNNSTSCVVSDKALGIFDNIRGAVIVYAKRELGDLLLIQPRLVHGQSLTKLIHLQWSRGMTNPCQRSKCCALGISTGIFYSVHDFFVRIVWGRW